MKLPKGFGGGGLGDMLAQAKGAMERAKNLDAELEQERLEIDKGPIKMVFNGLAELQSMKIDPSVVDPNDIEMLEDMIVGAVRAGFQQASDMRAARVKDIVPDIPGLNL